VSRVVGNRRSHRLALAAAAPVTRAFEFSSTSGPLQFGPTLGSFRYDDTTADSGGSGDWWIRAGTVSINDFVYSLAGQRGSWSTRLNRLLPLNPVREPTPLALLAVAGQ
jgi:hypothetical protein